MKPVEQLVEVDIPGDVLINNIVERVKHNSPNLWHITDIPGHIQWENVKVKGSKVLIEKSSAYASGMIECTVMRQLKRPS